jgi:hypothetical protein
MKNLQWYNDIGFTGHIKKSEEVSILDKSSLSHCSYVCTYHIVFIPKYRRRIMYGTLKKDIVEILKKLL